MIELSRTHIIVLTSVLVGGAVLVSRNRSAAAGTKKKSSSAPDRGSGGVVQGGKQLAWKYLQAAEKVSGIDGFAEFGMAVAYNESRFNNLAKNTRASEAEAACVLYKLKNNQWARDSQYPESSWCWGSGGWYGMIPVSGMYPKPFRGLNPKDAVLDPAASTAMAVDMVVRLTKYFGSLPASQRNFTAIRRGWASPSLVAKPDAERSKAVEERFRTSLKAAGLGTGVMKKIVDISRYPGPTEVWQTLKAL